MYTKRLLTIGFVFCFSMAAVTAVAQDGGIDFGSATFDEIQAWIIAGATFLIGRVSVFIPKIAAWNRTWVVFAGGLIAIVIFTIFQGFQFTEFLGQLKTVAATMAGFDLFKNLKLPEWLRKILGIKLQTMEDGGVRATTDPGVKE